MPLPSLAPVGSEPAVLLPAVLAGLRLAGAAVVVVGLDVDFVDALLSKLRTAVSVASQVTVTPMLRTIEILVYAWGVGARQAIPAGEINRLNRDRRWNNTETFCCIFGAGIAGKTSEIQL